MEEGMERKREGSGTVASPGVSGGGSSLRLALALRG